MMYNLFLQVVIEQKRSSMKVKFRTSIIFANFAN